MSSLWRVDYWLANVPSPKAWMESNRAKETRVLCAQPKSLYISNAVASIQFVILAYFFPKKYMHCKGNLFCSLKMKKNLKSRVLGKIVYKFWSPRDLYTMTLCAAAAAVLSTHDTFSSVSHFVHFLRKPRKTECMQWPNAMDIFFSFARVVSCVYILLLASKPLPSLHLLYKACTEN